MAVEAGGSGGGGSSSGGVRRRWQCASSCSLKVSHRWSGGSGRTRRALQGDRKGKGEAAVSKWRI